MYFFEQDQTLYVTSFYAYLEDLKNAETQSINSVARIELATTVASLRGEFFNAYGVGAQLEDNDFDDEIYKSKISNYSEQLSETNLEELSNNWYSSQEIAELYADLLVSAIKNVPLYLLMKRELQNILSNVVPLCSPQFIKDKNIKSYLQDEYSMKVFGRECKEAVKHCGEILTAIIIESEEKTPNYENILPRDFSFERFHAMMNRSLAYLFHRMEDLDETLKCYDDLDPIQETKSVKNVAKYKALRDRAQNSLSEFSKLIEQTQTILLITNRNTPDIRQSNSSQQLFKMRSALELRNIFEDPSRRFTHCALKKRNGRVPSKVDVILAMVTLEDLYRSDKTIEASSLKIRGIHSIAEHVAYFLELPDNVIEYFIDNDVREQGLAQSKEPSPLFRIVGNNANVLSSHYQDFCLLSAMRYQQEIPLGAIEGTYISPEEKRTQILHGVEHDAIVYLTRLKESVGSQIPRPPSTICHFN